VRQISAEQKEPEWMLEHRLKSLEIFYSSPMPKWGPDLSGLDLEDIVYYARAKQGQAGIAKDWNDVDPAIKAKFDRLGIPEAEKKYLAGVGGQFDSQTVYHNIKEKRAEQ
jgi:Fe-S cluster assembly protein SufB